MNIAKQDVEMFGNEDFLVTFQIGNAQGSGRAANHTEIAPTEKGYESCLSFFNQGWVGSIIGLLGLSVGVIGLVLYFKGRIGARPTYQVDWMRLVERWNRQCRRKSKFVSSLGTFLVSP